MPQMKFLTIRARLSGNSFAALHVEHMMDEIERAIPTPTGRNNRTMSSAEADPSGSPASDSPSTECT